MTVAVALSLGIFVSVQADDTLQKSLDDNSQVRTSFCGVNRALMSNAFPDWLGWLQQARFWKKGME